MTFISQKRHLTTVSNKRIYRRRKRRRLSKRGRYAAIVGIAALVLFITLLVVAGTRRQKAEKQTVSEKTYPDITFDVRFLDPNPFSRPQLALKKPSSYTIQRIPEWMRWQIAIILTICQRQMKGNKRKRMPAVILSLDWTVQLYSVFHWKRWLMPQTIEIPIRFPLSAAIKRKMGNLPRRHRPL